MNRRNGETSAAVGDPAAEQEITKEQVERMSGKDVRKNYKNIIHAMKNWRFN